MKKFALLFALSSLLSLSLNARHIIGGVITYECLGNGDYEFTMKVYRDCNCNNCADFDRNAPIAIFRCGVGGTPCSSLDQNDEIHKFYVGPPVIERVPNPDYPCLIPPDVCVQEGVYKWKMSDLGISLPAVNESYHITYQRCCRNETINNLNRPDDQGATFTVEITPAAQQACNNSPVFDSFPPTIICAGSPIDFDHSASDADGDQIIYEFCSPLQGGGDILGGQLYNSCNGAQPDPPCPPPYNGVNFITPTYRALEPIVGSPPIRIDANTGMITGTPELQGQYVVGVCATEYRNGLALSRVIRDFQFNVADCDPTVVATMEADEVSADNEDYIFRLCGDRELTITNTSFQQRFIDSHEWQFDIGGVRESFSDWSPSISFPDTGIYKGNLYLNPGSDCGDTVNVLVSVYPAITPDFDFDYDTCVAGPVEFTNLSSVDGSTIIDSRWTFADGGSSTDRNPSYEFKIPGNLQARLVVKDNRGCSADIIKTVTYFPVPNLIVIAPSSEKGCQPLDVFFDNLSTPIDESYDIQWNFGDGATGTDISPDHLYDQPGVYTVSVDITSPIGCQTDTTFNGLIEVVGSPEAAFDYNPKLVTTFQRTVDFVNQSQRERTVTWNFNNTFRTIEENPSFTFRDTGLHIIQLVAIHESGCRDTVEARIDVIPQVTYYLPNAFTPNNDSNNDTYKGVGFFEGMQNFRMNIWNRWGEMIFESTDPDNGWNGLKNNTGEPAPNGVYVVTVQYIDPRGKPHELQGAATVVR